MKSNVDEFENKKKILHIFNLKYRLDNKTIENLPIGLFGDFYSHELSFSLIKNNDYKNLNNIFNKCNLKIKKVLLKSFVEGSHLSNKNPDLDTFFQIKINDKNSKIFYFENDALKFEQIFNFGSDIIINDISKITSLEKDFVKKILSNSVITQKISEEELVENKLFKTDNYRKKKKKLILEIASSRIQEISDIFILKNINFKSYHEKNKVIFLNINDQSILDCFKESFILFLSNNNFFTIKFTEKDSIEDLINNTNNLVYYGWKKEAVPVVQPKKSLIARFFDILFG